MTEIMSDPWHFAVWLTGAAVWAILAIVLVAFSAFLICQAIYATAYVAKQLLRIALGRVKRNRDCTIKEAWLYAFRYGGLSGLTR